LNAAARGAAAVPERVLQSRKIYARLLRYAWPYRAMYMVGVLGMVLYAGSDLITVFFTKTYLHDALALQQHQIVLRWLPLGVLLIFLSRGVGDYLANYFPFWVGRQVVKAIRGELFAHYLQLPTAQYDRESSAVKLNRLTYNAEMVAAATTDSVPDGGRSGDRVPGAQRQRALPALQHPHPELDGRCHARVEGGARRPPRGQGVQCPAAHPAPVRTGQ
jgi:ABC-type multidrug transport system fused ATPase/permease subunit